MGAHQYRILAVDDSADDLFFLQRAFRKTENLTVVATVPDGEQAIAYFRAEAHFADRQLYPTPDLVLLDLKMPKVDGFGVLQWLRDHPQEQCRVVVFTSSSNESDRRRALDLGAHSVFIKPSNPAGYIAFASSLASEISATFGTTIVK